MNNKCVYLLITNDKYELPTAIADTLKELHQITGISYFDLKNSYYRKETCFLKKYRVVKVEIPKEEDDFEFNFTDYVRYCDLHNLKPNLLSSLDRYRKHCID